MKKIIKILLCLVILLIMLSPIRINASSQDSSRGIVITDYIDIVSEGIKINYFFYDCYKMIYENIKYIIIWGG